MKRRIAAFLAMCMALSVGVMPAARGAEGEPVIPYTTRRGEAAAFSPVDFDAACRQATGEKLEWIQFTLPPESRGTLWYNLGQKGVRRVDAQTRYEPDGDLRLGLVSFLPAERWTGTATVTFLGRGKDKGEFTGRVEITVDAYAGDLEYTAAAGEPLYFSAGDLDKICRETTGQKLDYIRFGASSGGTLWRGYGTDDRAKVSSSTAYYAAAQPGIEEVCLALPDGEGVYTVAYTAYSSGDRTFDGTIRVEVGEKAAGDVNLRAVEGSPVLLSADSVDLGLRNLAGKGWKSVRITPPLTSVGTFYYDYQGQAQRKVSAQDVWTPTGESAVGNLTFVPAAGVTGRVMVNLNAVTEKGKKVQGVLVITYSEAGDRKLADIYYTTGVHPVKLRKQDFLEQCRRLGAGELRSVKFTLPDRSQGRLWVSYVLPTKHSGGLVSQDTRYRADQLDGLAFVPAAGFQGEVRVQYTATDENGASYPGTVAIVVQPEKGSSRFGDLKEAQWVIPAAEFLARFGVVQGTGAAAFEPDKPIGRGDFVLMLARAYGLTEGRTAADGFADVPQESYYAVAVTAAKDLGIAQGSGGRFDPTANLTRQDAMVLLHRTLEILGRDLAPGEEERLAGFGDQAEIAEYAKPAMAALVQAGVLEGNAENKLRPREALTRGEMALILYRVLTL